MGRHMSGFFLDVFDSSGMTRSATVTLHQINAGQIGWRAVLLLDSGLPLVLEGHAPDAGAVEDDLRRMVRVTLRSDIG